MFSGAFSIAEDVVVGARLVLGLPSFFRQSMHPTAARRVVAQRLQQREADFLVFARWAIYDNRRSPYRALLQRAGCEPGDLELLVEREGLEGALEQLYHSGVYLTLDELKGRCTVRRGSLELDGSLRQLRNPRSAASLPVASSGSGGASASGVIDLASIRDQAVDLATIISARGGEGWRKAFWGVPGSVALLRMLDLSLVGPRPVGWFSQIDPRATGLHPRYAQSVRALRWGAWLAGMGVPSPVYAPLDDPAPVARWLATCLLEGATPFLWAHATPGLRVCQSAMELGLNIEGAHLSIGGEPTTRARLEAIARAGVAAVPHFATMECGIVAYGCLSPAAPDDLHLLDDLHAVICSSDPDAGHARAGPLLLTSLRPTARFVLLNASLGDHGEIVSRSCGCPLEAIGWKRHLQTIRSQAKVTVGGVTVLDADIVRALEDGVAARFGGGPGDYQLVEEECEDGQPAVRLLVSPALGALDHEALALTFLTALGAGNGAQRVAAEQWRHGSWLTVERRVPYSTEAGKVRHVWRSDARANGHPSAERG